MAGSTSKKVRVLRFQREAVHGFVQGGGFPSMSGVDLLTTEGVLVHMPYEEIKAVCFVQDFNDPPFRLDGAQFVSRPKSAGLWVRMKFRDGAQLDGLLSSQLLQLDPFGFTIAPPDPGVNPQRVFVPRAALADIQVLAVVGSGLTQSRKKSAAESQQSKLF